MKFKYQLLAGVCAIAGLASCVSENQDIDQPKGDVGFMSLDVTMLKPSQTRADDNTDYSKYTEVYDFPLILKKADGTIQQQWNRVDDYQAMYSHSNPYRLSVGNYTVESHSVGQLRKKMETPYYAGSKDIEITKDVVSDVNLLCKMQNSKIEVNFSADFASVFETWSVTFNDGGETALSFTQEDGVDPAPIYWWFEGEVEKLTMDFKATLKDGGTVSDRQILTKDDADENYDDDQKNFSGGDVLVIDIEPAPADVTTGKITGITINSTVTFDETNVPITVRVTDANGNPNTGGDNPGPGPGGDDDIVLTLPKPITMEYFGAEDLNESDGDVLITAKAGIKSIIVKVKSTNEDEMMGTVAKLQGVDLINGQEVVESQALVDVLAAVGKPGVVVPKQGDTSYSFPVGKFFDLLQVIEGTHTFELTVTDMNDKQKSGSVQLTVLPM